MDDIDSNNRVASYSQVIISANGLNNGAGTGKINIPFTRCMLYCEYQYKNSSTQENAIIFGAQGYQNQNIGNLDPSSKNIGNDAIGFNKSPS
jgi:hypothetical protein